MNQKLSNSEYDTLISESFKNSSVKEKSIATERLNPRLFHPRYVHLKLLKKHIKRLVNGYLIPGKNIKLADMGCGAGFTTNALKNYYESSLVFGYEISYDAIEYAKNKFPQCHFEQKKIDPSLDLGDIKFDLISYLSSKFLDTLVSSHNI